ncbi:hypothetical protein K3495_g1312 [Podosphaera aphanis]|nr:hypothetical protein K3495_g1312 [Podosphaera aphanis]
MQTPKSPFEHLLTSAAESSSTAHHSQFSSYTRSDASGADGATHLSTSAVRASYRTKKHAEDVERLEAHLVDKNWDATQYGDPLAASNEKA